MAQALSYANVLLLVFGCSSASNADVGFKLGCGGTDCHVRFAPVLMQTNKVSQTDDLFSWSAGFFGDCVKDSASADNVGLQHRVVNCTSLYTGENVSFDKCAGEMPCPTKLCECAGMVCKKETENGESREWQTKCETRSSKHKFEEFGCMAGPETMAAVNRGDPLDWSCLNSTDPQCYHGLPFYNQYFPEAEACMMFCIEEGLDIAGVADEPVQGMRQCRCGASRVNKAAWHLEEPRADLVLTKSLVFPRGEGSCPVRLFRYSGFYQGYGVPAELLNINEEFGVYADSIAAGWRIPDESTEDGLDAYKDDGEQLSLRSISHSRAISGGDDADVPGWQRTSSEAQAGSMWPDRTPTNPSNEGKVFQEYVRIYYYFDSTAQDQGRKEVFREAVKRWREQTCIQLVETVPESAKSMAAYLAVGRWDDTKCWSYLGHDKGERKINLGWCNSGKQIGNVVHEIGHLVGMNHEQKRPDAASSYHGRGPYLKLHWDNIPAEWEPQWKPDPKSYTGSDRVGYSPYDFKSIMHYGGGDKVDTIPRWEEPTIGQRRALSSSDVAQINDVYGCRAPSPPLTTCAWEGGWCSCKGLVRYGITDRWTGWKAVDSRVKCVTRNFHDPARWRYKRCQCQPS